MPWTSRSELRRISQQLDELLAKERVIDSETRFAARLTIGAHYAERPPLPKKLKRTLKLTVGLMLLLLLGAAIAASVAQTLQTESTQFQTQGLDSYIGANPKTENAVAYETQLSQSEHSFNSANHEDQLASTVGLSAQLLLTFISLVLAVLCGALLSRWIDRTEARVHELIVKGVADSDESLA